MQIHELPEITSISSGGYLATDNGTQTTKIDYAKLAKAIIEQYSGSTLAGSAQSVKAALDGLNSNAYTLSLGTAIPSGADLTSYTTPGTFYISSNSIASSLNALPESTAGRFMVETEGTTGTVRQIYKPYNSTLEYVRRISGATVTTWEKQPTRAEVDALNSNFGGMRIYMDNSNALSYSFKLSTKDNSVHSTGIFFGTTAANRGFLYMVWIPASTTTAAQVTKIYDGVASRIFEASYDRSAKVLTIQRTDATEAGDRIFGGVRLIIG